MGLKSKIAAAFAGPTRSDYADEFGRLTAELAQLDRTSHYKAKEKRVETLRAQILGLYPDLPGDQTATESGSKWDVEVTECDNKRQVTELGKRALYKLWGVRKFFGVCTVALKDLPDPDDKAGLYTAQERAGSRHLKPFPKAAAKTKAA